MVESKVKNGIDFLRNAVGIFNDCSEDFNQQFTSKLILFLFANILSAFLFQALGLSPNITKQSLMLFDLAMAFFYIFQLPCRIRHNIFI